ncbi:hypothetical protein K0M31_011344 [Melipona bicolor]|uniref:Uncharacterized protein n=1 Tax=Melipona bicolor TaxID=60889 RepID=A0AA40G9D6_9HYME|nr:hypothetical protein K0M31_011344 [Melipona bicolor]
MADTTNSRSLVETSSIYKTRSLMFFALCCKLFSSLSSCEPEFAGSYEELLQEVLGKQVLQIIVHPVVLVRWAGFADAEYRQAEVLHLDARLRRASRVVAALRVPFDPGTPMMMMIAGQASVGIAGSPITPADFTQ